MKVFQDLSERYNALYEDGLDRLNRCVMAHGGKYVHDVEKYGPLYARCWNEDEDGIELYDVYSLYHDEDGELIMEVESHNGNAYYNQGERFTKYATELIIDYFADIIANMTEPEIGYGQHFKWSEMNKGAY